MDEKWLVIRTVCTVNESQTERTLKTIDSFSRFIFHVFPKSDVILAGYASESIWQHLKSSVENQRSLSPVIAKFSIDEGKAVVINKTIAQRVNREKHLWVFCSDSDIDFSTIKITSTMILENWTILSNRFDYIALNQSGDCRHNPGLLAQSPEEIAGQRIVAKNSYVGIAGGAFSLSLECWWQIGGIPEINGGYGPEDVLLLKRLRTHACRTCIWIELCVRHPELENDNNPREMQIKSNASLSELSKNYY